MATESDIALGVMRIAAQQNDRIATFKRCYREIPNIVALDAINNSPSLTRHGEKMWQQLVRNIKSHQGSDGNYITLGLLEHVPRVGFRITAAGLAHLAHN